MRTIKLTLAYDGTDYVGWQRQARGRSIQGEVERALAEIEGRAVVAVGAGRTDAGVHALGQVAGVQLAHAIETPALVRAVNAKLPPDIRVLAAEAASAGFHARYAARRKTYRYNLVSGAVASPFGRRYAWHVRPALDVEAMRAAAAAFGGRHDFAAFQAVGTEVASSVRTVRSVSVEPANIVLGAPSPAGKPGLTIDVVGDGFLRHMVRIMVGTLVAVGSGRVPATQVRAILASRSRERAGPTAPPHGLFLVAVDY
ncbi:MAG: tRNA pseudouridine(38-40) synthase TruA [Acidobacteria bacterium]|nr:tRNA pseudouridine(38-40) synthase TruA [Acidobacteriota bacterium]